MSHLPPIAKTWPAAEKIAYLERQANLCDIEARSDRAWPHHRQQAARAAAEMRTEVKEIQALERVYAECKEIALAHPVQIVINGKLYPPDTSR